MHHVCHMALWFPKQKHTLLGTPIPLFSLKGQGSVGRLLIGLPVSLSDASPKRNVQAPRKTTSAAVVISGHLLPELSCARPPLCLPFAYSRSPGCWPGFSGSQSIAQLNHEEKCIGVVYVVGVCLKRQWVRAWAGAWAPDSQILIPIPQVTAPCPW